MNFNGIAYREVMGLKAPLIFEVRTLLQRYRRSAAELRELPDLGRRFARDPRTVRIFASLMNKRLRYRRFLVQLQ